MRKYEHTSSIRGNKTRLFYGYVIVAACFLIVALIDGSLYTFGVFLKSFSEEFGWTRAATAGAFSLTTLLSGFLYILTGRLTDRYGPRVVLTICGLLFGLGYLLMSQINTLWQFYLFFGVITAMGVSGDFPPVVSTVARWFVKRRGVMTGIVVSGIGVGTMILPPVATNLIASYNWRTAFLILGGTVLILVMLAAQFLRRDPSQKRQSPYGENESGTKNPNNMLKEVSLSQAMRSRQFWVLSIINFCFCFSILAIMAHIIPHATDMGLPPATAASIISVIAGVSIAGRIVMGGASDKIGNRPSLILSLALFSAPLFFLLVASELWMLYLFAVIFGFGYGGMVVLASPIVAEFFGLRAHGVIVGALTFAMTIGGAVGPVVAGHIFDTTGGYQLAFLISAMLSTAGLVLSFLLKFPQRVPS